MPSKQETLSAIELIEEQLTKLNCEVEEEIELDSENGKVRGLSCRREYSGHPFQILTLIDEEVPFFEVRYVFDAQSTIASELKKRSLDTEEVELDREEDEEYFKEARTRLVSLNKSEFRKTQKGLIERLASTEANYSVETIDDYGIESFHLQKKIFPLEEFYNISKLNKAIRAVINKGVLGGTFVAHSYEIEDFFYEELDQKEEVEDKNDLGYIG
ncbi:MAG: hypothetical protein ABEK16_02450 [Candidatus Nanohalobium sp.]